MASSTFLVIRPTPTRRSSSERPRPAMCAAAPESTNAPARQVEGAEGLKA
jgi:hypothetical protein